MNKNLILIIAILLILAGFFYLKSSLKKENSAVYKTEKFSNPNPQKKTVKSNLTFKPKDTCNGAFRFDIVDSNLFLFKETQTVLHHLYNKAVIKTYPYESIYTAFKNNDTLNFFSASDKNLYQYINNNFIQKKQMKVFGGNIITYNNTYYFTDTIPKKINEIRNHHAIKNGSGKVLFDITSFIQPYLKDVDKNCYSPYTEGLLYNYSKDTIAYLFQLYDVLALINVNDGRSRTITTQAKYKFIPYKSFTVTDPISGRQFTKYEPEIEQAYIHSSLSSNDDFVFIRSDFIHYNKDKKPYEFIDVYQKYNFIYLSSIAFSLSNNESILDVRSNNNDVFILTTEGNIYSLSVANEKFN